jgi:hypothetical protein
MSHHQANFEPLNTLEFLLTVLFVSKAADPCVSSGLPSVLVQLSLPVGVNNFLQLSFYSSMFLVLFCSTDNTKISHLGTIYGRTVV